MQALKKSEPLVRCSVTMPPGPSDSSTSRRTSVAPSPEPHFETLFTHPSVRIVSFMATSGLTSGHNPNTSLGLEEEVGTLSWTSPLERLITVGRLSIYRATGSVAFLSCRKVMHPILPKSQCWCVDESSSTFVLQIRRPQYWRIEVPLTDPDNQRIFEDLKEVLSQILLFEKTPCPFRRSFTVDLPEAPTTPLKKRPWRPVHKPKSQADEAHLPDARRETERVKQCDAVVSDHNMDYEGGNKDGDATDDMNVTLRTKFSQSLSPPSLYQDMIKNLGALRTSRSVTAPPQLTIVTSSPSGGERTMPPLSRSKSIESTSSGYSSSVDSFHTVQSWHSPITPLPPSPPDSNPASPTTYPYPHENISLPKRHLHTRETSEITITPETPRVSEICCGSIIKSMEQVDERHSTPPPKTPTLANDSGDSLDEEYFEIVTPLAHQQPDKHRTTTDNRTHRRELSPLPPPANVFSPSLQHPMRLQTARHIPIAIIQKTYEILCSPPSHLIHLMLNVVAKIAAGEWRGVLFGFGEEGEKVVSQWDYEDDRLTRDALGEDDYGISLGGKQYSNLNSSTARERVGRSWEVD